MPATSSVQESSRDTPPSTNGVSLTFSFPGRRYHATPWGDHVNEGHIEWPPSPWRLLRALLATGYTKLNWPGEGPPVVARSLMEKLSASLPRYRLPPAVGTHSRHYMPMARFKNGREETSMVLDTWAQLDEGSIDVYWDVALTHAERSLLETLARALGYLGRSESWVEGKLLSPDAVDQASFDVRPGDVQDRPGPGWEQVSLLCALSSADYLIWRERSLNSAIEKLPKANGTKPLTKAQHAKQLLRARAAYPEDLIDCLQVETAWLHAFGWSQPPGSRKVLYWRRSDSLEGGSPSSRAQLVEPAPVEFMLLSVATASGNNHALPGLNRTLPQGELLHRAVLSAGPKGKTPSPMLSGRDANGRPLSGSPAHRHAHLLHLDLDEDGHLDHVLIWAPQGLEAEAQSAIRAVRRTFTKGGTAPLRLAMAAAGSRQELAALALPLGKGLRQILGEGELGARTWRSVTPFVPARFLKSRGRNALEGQLAAELAGRKLPAIAEFRVVDPHDDDLARRARHFVCARRTGAPPPVAHGFIVELTLTKPCNGPLVLGYGCHFGLGLFQACTFQQALDPER